MRKALDFILGRLPDQNAKIIELYHKDEDFRILCEDYMSSADAMREENRCTAVNSEIKNEFLEVHLELEKEINRLLDT